MNDARGHASEADMALVSVRDAVFDLSRGLKMTTVFGNPGSTELDMCVESRVPNLYSFKGSTKTT